MRNPVLLVLIATAVGALLNVGFVTLAPNRLTTGRALMVWQVIPAPGLAMLTIGFCALFTGCLLPPRRPIHWGSLTLAAILLLSLAALAGSAAGRLLQSSTPAARIGLGAAYWTASACLVLGMADSLQRVRAGSGEQWGVIALTCCGFATLGWCGWLSPLSLCREYTMHRALFGLACLQHLALVAGTVLPALAIGAPLALAGRGRPRLQSSIFAVLNVVQTIPAIALFGLLIAPLSALAIAVPALGRAGIGGIGIGPALIALVLYALLPVVRSIHAGLAAVDGAVIEAARGMGMAPRQILLRLELPLAAPVLLAGLRIVLVQTIGLAVVAALIGAGGLGTFVFQGLGQYATDLVLLGALPTILMALAADLALRSAVAATRGGGRS